MQAPSTRAPAVVRDRGYADRSECLDQILDDVAPGHHGKASAHLSSFSIPAHDFQFTPGGGTSARLQTSVPLPKLTSELENHLYAGNALYQHTQPDVRLLDWISEG